MVTRSTMAAVAVIVACVLACVLGSAVAMAAESDPRFAALDGLSEASLVMNFTFPETTLPELMKIISEASGVEIKLRQQPGKPIPESRVKEKFAFQATGITLKDALIRIATEHRLDYVVLGPRQLRIVLAE